MPENVEVNAAIKNFLSSFGKELTSKMHRLDEIIGRDHWLSVGTYKESLLRAFLRDILPRRFEVSTGFVMSMNSSGELIKSRQLDIIVWDSSNYSPIFRDGEFVIVPPEACKAVVEVKGKLTLDDIKSTVDSFDYLSYFVAVPLSQGFKIRRYIFAFDLEERVAFPSSILKKLAKCYQESRLIEISERQVLIQRMLSTDTFCFDGIYILGKGTIQSESRGFHDNKMRLIFRSFQTSQNEKDMIVALFESDVQSVLGAHSNGNPGLWYIDQPGLQALRQCLDFRPTTPKYQIIVPKIRRDQLYLDMNGESVYAESFEE